MPSGRYQYISISEQQRRWQRIRRAIEIVIFVCFVAIPIGIISIDGASLPNKLLALKPGKPGFKTWLNPPITTVRNYHLFNVTNPDEFLRKPKSMLNLSDSRPYVYDVKTNRMNIRWHENDTEMSYEVERIFARHPKLFDPASLKDRGHFVNMVRTLIRSKFGVTPSAAIGAALDGEPPFRDDPIEILEGYFSDSFRKVQERMVGPNTEKYGLVYRQNGSRLYNITIRTDLFIKGQMLEFASELSPFKISRAENYPYPVYDGLTFPAMLFNQTRINVFNSDFCRPIRIEYNGTVSKFGFGTIYKYVLKLIDFDSCTDPADDRTCPEVDKIDVSKCLSDTLDPNTIFLSKAHFYGSSSETVEDLKIHGFNPSAAKHDSIIYFEPFTGTPIQATYRIQMNVVAKIDPMKRNEAGTWDFTFKKSESRTLPVFWIEQRVEVSRGTVWTLRIVVMLIKGPSPWIIFPLFIGVAILIIGTIEICARRFGY